MCFLAPEWCHTAQDPRLICQEDLTINGVYVYFVSEVCSSAGLKVNVTSSFLLKAT